MSNNYNILIETNGIFLSSQLLRYKYCICLYVVKKDVSFFKLELLIDKIFNYGSLIYDSY